MEDSNCSNENKDETMSDLACHVADTKIDAEESNDISTADEGVEKDPPTEPLAQCDDGPHRDVDTKSVSSHAGSENSEDATSEELQQGFRILKELMSDSKKSVNWPFMWPVDSSLPDTADYYEKIPKPMWLNKSECTMV